MQSTNKSRIKNKAAEDTVYYAIHYTALGKILISAENEYITGIDFVEKAPKQMKLSPTPLTDKAVAQLEEYFSGKRQAFDLPINPKGTEFQQKVWKFLQTIPYGETRTYKQVATAAGNSKASRAAGMANNKNPLSIVVPCHRVIGSNGKLVGYAGGLGIKERLLELEQQNK